MLESDLGSHFQTPVLARLDLATGKIKYLQAGWIGPDQSVAIAW
jgi:hypothetical protein